MKFSVLVILSSLLFFQAEIVFSRPDIQGCPGGHSVNKTFSSGAKWDLCWQEKSSEGVVFSNIYYSTPGNSSRRVLGEASLSQIQTDFDDGSTQIFWVTNDGLGGNSLIDLSIDDCLDGELLQNNGKSVLCKITRPMGYIWKNGSQQRQGDYLDLFSISKINNITYIVSWQFYESGIIRPTVGISGALTKFGSNQKHGWAVSENNQIAIGFTNHYFWRLDFDLESDSGNDVVEIIDSIPSSDRMKKSKQITSINTETAFSMDIDKKRFWRVRDGFVKNSNVGYVSYELILLNYARQGNGNKNEAWLRNDLFVTSYTACERFAVKNSTQNGCGGNVSQFVNGENTNEKDVVIWYRASYHHLPRDEDINKISTRWTGLQLLPRDWSSANPL